MKAYLFLSLTLAPSLCFAYLDPGSGNALVYLLISLGGACVYFLKTAYYKILGWVTGKKYTSDSNFKNAPIILFSEGKAYWYTFKPVIEALIEKKESFRYYTMDVQDPALRIDNPYMISKYIGKGSTAFAKLSRVGGSIMVATTPNIGCPGYPMARPPRIIKMAHISHAVSDISYLKKGSLDNYDVSFDIGHWCESRIRKIESLRRLPAKECVVVGLPYLDELAKHVKKKSVKDTPACILIAPSWGDKNCLKVHGTQFLFDLLNAGYNIILRPHPQSKKADGWLYDPLFKELESFKNCKIDLSLDARQSMEMADLLISDSSSFKFDFAFLYQKPVVTMYVPAGDLASFEASDLGGTWDEGVINKLGNVIRPGEKVNICDKVEDTLSMPLEDLDRLYSKIVENRGQAGRKIAEYLIENK